MRIDPAAAKEHDEIVELTSTKGDKARYKINKMSKTVHIETAPGDGNHEQWRLTNVSYDSIANHLGRNSDGSVAASPAAPIEPVSVFEKPSEDA